MEKISVMIVEDMQLVADDIASKLRKHGMEVTGIYNTGEDAIASFETDHPDLVLMDIQLAGAYDGISTAKLITDRYHVPLIYLSDFIDEQTVGRATKTLPQNYLAKPFNEGDLIRAIHLAFANFKASGKTTDSKDHIFVKDEKNALIKLQYADILYIKANRAYCSVVTEDRTLLLTVSMNHVVDQIGHRDFVKAHRSHVVNIRKVTGIEGNILRLGKHEVEMSTALRNEVMSKLNIL